MYLPTKRDTFNNNNDNSFDKDIPDADSKKIIQHNFKLEKKICMNICELCVENVRKRDILRHDEREAMYYDKAGSLCNLGIMSNLSMGRKVVFVSGKPRFKINVLN